MEDDEKCHEKTKDLNDEPKKLSNHDEKQGKYHDSIFDLRTKRGQILFFGITILMAVLIKCLPKDIFTHLIHVKLGSIPYKCTNNNETIIVEEVAEKRPKYLIYPEDGPHLKHVHNILERIGMQQVYNETDDWDLMWGHELPFSNLNLRNLKVKQRVNHFPGTGFITNKVDLATTDLKYIPKSFKLPSDTQKFKEYAISNPEKLFVQKHYQHRHIQIKKLNEMDFNDDKSFVQEFIDNPLLVDGHKFDIGVYTIITSIDPLRVYIYKGDILFRFCPTKYHPFDASNVDKYIVGDDYLPIWQVDSLKYYYNELGFGMKDSFDAHIRNSGRDPSMIWTQVEDAIRSLILKKQHLLKNALQKYAYKWNFFEMMRFDLIINEDLQVYLMEANMSPNLSSAHFKPNRILYEQIIYHLMKLLGIGSDLHRESLARRTRETEIMLSNDKNIAVNAKICASLCLDSCEAEDCRVCRPCLTQNDSIDLHKSYREHINRGDTKRIFPVPKKDKNLEDFNDLSRNNKFMTIWFDEKCKIDESYC